MSKVYPKPTTESGVFALSSHCELEVKKNLLWVNSYRLCNQLNKFLNTYKENGELYKFVPGDEGMFHVPRAQMNEVLQIVGRFR